MLLILHTAVRASKADLAFSHTSTSIDDCYCTQVLVVVYTVNWLVVSCESESPRCKQGRETCRNTKRPTEVTLRGVHQPIEERKKEGAKESEH